jgi:DNA-binding NarL/FixJ family response regulator
MLMERKLSSQEIIPIVVVEDNRLLREGIVTILQRHPDLEVVGVVEDAEAALLLMPETEARVVLVDAGLGDHDSHDFVEQLGREFPNVRVIVMDILPDTGDVVEFVRRGASGFVVKEASIDSFVGTIRTVAGGAEVLPPSLTNTIFTHIAQRAATGPRASVNQSVQMTTRERQVIDLITEGMSNKLIARHLRISPHTVKSHVRNILEKLALHSRLQVAAYALRTESLDIESD